MAGNRFQNVLLTNLPGMLAVLFSQSSELLSWDHRSVTTFIVRAGCLCILIFITLKRNKPHGDDKYMSIPILDLQHKQSDLGNAQF